MSHSPTGPNRETRWHEVTQTILWTPEDEARGVYGNCVQAAVASLLMLPIEAVPHFVTFMWWPQAFELWLRGKNLTHVEEQTTEVPAQGGPCLVGGISPRGVEHTVIGCDGEIVWDPHPSRSGLVSITDVTWVREWEHPSLVKCWLCSDAHALDFTPVERIGKVAL